MAKVKVKVMVMVMVVVMVMVMVTVMVMMKQGVVMERARKFQERTKEVSSDQTELGSARPDQTRYTSIS